MPITPRFFAERVRRRAAALGIEPARLPPGQSPTVKWPVLSVGPTPKVDVESWLLSVDGAVAEPYVLDWDELIAADQLDWSGDIHCVTRWSKFGMRWRGVSARALIERARPISARALTPRQRIPNFDHRVTQWMSPLQSSWSAAINSSQSSTYGSATAPSTDSSQLSTSTFGVGPTDSTGHF